MGGAKPSKSIIQFTCEQYYAREDEKVISVGVMRLGDATVEAIVDFETQDGSAKAGDKYVGASGTLYFAKGELSKSIDVAIIDDNSWDAALTFNVVLSNCVGAELALYLHTCKVWIIDDDAFPTNKYRDQGLKGDAIPGYGLFVQYAKFNLGNPKLRAATISHLLMDQVKNLYFVLQTYLQMYLIDVVLADKPPNGGSLMTSLLVPGNRTYTAICVGVLYTSPFFLMQVVDYCKLELRVPAMAKTLLQINLLRKFLNYREEDRVKVSAGDVTMAMVRDVSEVVTSGYMKLIEMTRVFGKLVLVIIFILAENTNAILPLIIYPIAMVTFIALRGRMTQIACEEMAKKQNEVVESVNEAVKNYRVIADLELRNFIVDQYQERLIAYNDRARAYAKIVVNNKYLAPWLTTLLIGSYMICSPFQVKSLGGNVTLGVFLATMNMFREVGEELSEIYTESMEIMMAISPLRKVCHFMNEETDLQQRMDLTNMRCREGNLRRQRAHEHPQTRKEPFPVDFVDISLENVNFKYSENPHPTLRHMNLSIQQGRLYGVIGPPHEGKATFMKLLGQVLVPRSGEDGGVMFVPPHLRVLHLSQETYLFNQSLLTNIIFHHDVRKAGGLDRILQICQMLRFPPMMLKELTKSSEQKEARMTEWLKHLSHTDYHRLNLARVFVQNPEFLVVHKPALAFDDEEKENVFRLLKMHVDQRGLVMPPEGLPSRRRRTVLFTSASMIGLELADGVIEVSKEGVQYVDKRVLRQVAVKYLATTALRLSSGLSGEYTPPMHTMDNPGAIPVVASAPIAPHPRAGQSRRQRGASPPISGRDTAAVLSAAAVAASDQDAATVTATAAAAAAFATRAKGGSAIFALEK